MRSATRCAYSRSVRRLACVLMLAALPVSARAGGLVDDDGAPRTIGRAGTGTVAGDGGDALLVEPAGLARRDTWRVQLGAGWLDDSVDFRPAAGNAPRARDQAGSTVLPLVGIEGSIGDWLVGATFATAAASDRALADPGRVPPEQYGDLFDYRYAGLTGSLRRDTVAVGVARRIGEDVAFGVAIAGSRVALAESRAVWADHRAAEAIAAHPEHDVDVAFDASDDLVPSVIAGVLVAPPDTPIELAASLSWTRSAHLTGTASAGSVGDVQVATNSPAASVTLREPLTARAGARWLGSRWSAEVDGDLWLMPTAAAAWDVTGIYVLDATGIGAAIQRVPSRVAWRTHGAVRGAIDAELVEGFLWATAGYAYAGATTDDAHLSPTFGDLGGHTLALGLEASAGGFTITVGWSRTWSIARTTTQTAWQHDNPFAGADGPVPTGSYDGSRDLIGISVDAELAAPR